jgi:hypothetical protein
MPVPEALEKISKALALFALQTRAENLSGMFSKNRLTEDLLLPVLQIALNAPNLRDVLIEGLPSKMIYAMHDIIATSVIGETYIDVENYLYRISRRQIEYEKKSGKCVP